jgi:hypothetical protein
MSLCPVQQLPENEVSHAEKPHESKVVVEL